MQIHKIGRAVGYLLAIGSGILMFIFLLIAMHSWLGLLGTFIALFLTPSLVIFPIIFWIVEGVFPTFYFIVWGIGIAGVVIGGVSSKDD